MKRLEITFLKPYPDGAEDKDGPYFEELKNVDYKIFKRACERIRDTFKSTYEEPLPTPATILRYIDEARHGRFFVPPDESKPLTKEQTKNQEEINRLGRLKVAEKILSSPDAGSGAKEWARGVVERKGASLKARNGPEPIGDILTRN